MFVGIFSATLAQLSNLKIHSIDISQFPVNYVYYTAENSSGKDFGPVSEFDVQLYEDGVEQRIFFEEEEHFPSSLILILDSSGSMKQSMQDAISAARNLINKLTDYDYAEIIDFDSDVKIIQRFTNNKESLSDILNSITANGGTALYDAISQGINDIKNRRGLKVVLLLTDGKDENAKGDGPGSKITLDELKIIMKSANIPVYTIGLGSGIDKTTLEDIASVSGGKDYYAEETDAISKIYSDIIVYLHSLHRFYYVTHNGQHNNTKREIYLKSKSNAGIPNVKSFYVAPEAKYWTYAFWPEEKEWCVSNISISPDGMYIVPLRIFAVISKEGIRHYIHWDGKDAYDGICTGKYVQYRAHLHYGYLYEFDGENLNEVDSYQFITSASGDFNKDWEWCVKGISKGEKYIVFASRPEIEGKHKYYFMLYDMEENKALWVKHLYLAEFDEPGAVAVADNGTCLITQDFNLFAVDKNGQILFSWIWEQTGNRFIRLAITADGLKFIARLDEQQEVHVYNINGKLLWKVESIRNEIGESVDVSANGKYFAINDRFGPRILDMQGNILFEDKQTEPVICENGNNIAVANDGSFVYTLGPKMYYRKLE
jgi:VWFA-related protein